jgi:hypothetical protein
MNMGNQVTKRTKPIMMTTTPIMIPNTFDNVITPFLKALFIVKIIKRWERSQGEFQWKYFGAYPGGLLN